MFMSIIRFIGVTLIMLLICGADSFAVTNMEPETSPYVLQRLQDPEVVQAEDLAYALGYVQHTINHTDSANQIDWKAEVERILEEACNPGDLDNTPVLERIREGYVMAEYDEGARVWDFLNYILAMTERFGISVPRPYQQVWTDMN